MWLWCNSISVQSNMALCSADRLYVHVCVVSEEITAPCFRQTGYPWILKSVSKETLPRILTMPAFLGLLQMETDIWIKGIGIMLPPNSWAGLHGQPPFLHHSVAVHHLKASREITLWKGNEGKKPGLTWSLHKVQWPSNNLCISCLLINIIKAWKI